MATPGAIDDDKPLLAQVVEMRATVLMVCAFTVVLTGMCSWSISAQRSIRTGCTTRLEPRLASSPVTAWRHSHTSSGVSRLVAGISVRIVRSQTGLLHACRWVVPLVWLPLAGLMAWRAIASLPFNTFAVLITTGVLLWQLIEYSLHRWLFHAKPASPRAIVAHFLMHG
jgi:hypothetical protein